MICYYDTSALTKLYIQETGSPAVSQLWRYAEGNAVSIVAYAEVLSAFQRRLRESTLTPLEYQQILQEFRLDWENLFLISVSSDVNQIVEALISRHGLRGFDAIQLASALNLKSRLDTDIAFVCADRRLNGAARAEGLQLLPVFWD
ncbi:MAG: type II toxin-antitoxin system VapC family toxin [Candidatus Sumerlaeota bacterium]|nr:type II toxin-antitoxin system VapC family toxin [Candidatus Sumerlaeota bacterium]